MGNTLPAQFSPTALISGRGMKLAKEITGNLPPLAACAQANRNLHDKQRAFLIAIPVGILARPYETEANCANTMASGDNDTQRNCRLLKRVRIDRISFFWEFRRLGREQLCFLKGDANQTKFS